MRMKFILMVSTVKSKAARESDSKVIDR